MYREHTIGVVVPAYNEEGLISDVIWTMPDYVDWIYAIDDCSTDGTWEEIQHAAHEDAIETEGGGQIGRERALQSVRADGGVGDLLTDRARIHSPIGRVVPIQHRENMGAGGAIKTGYLAALKDELDITVTMDGDGQMDPNQMVKLLDPLVEDAADYAKGNRLLYREYREGMSNFRFLGNSILTFLTKIASGYWKTMDPQNGYTAITHYALENADIENMYEYYGYCNDLLVKLNARNLRVADVAMPAIYGEEASSIRYPTYIRKVSGMLLRNYLWRLKVKYLVMDFHPLAFFYIFGVSTMALGMVGGLWSVYVKFLLNGALFVRASLSMMLFLIGSLFLLFAMLFDMQVNKDYEVQIHE
ncbi:glycosyltransferase family 2 protein [Natronocalculus amylovorans]|uniref:Glycosyltransferase family 2 protein n=1 Tax=Natronocalculus amylovorans TaxID=2917812 RepID=A0AAE3K9R3_9EURY|nr:glycosyltransferase family 2 protein [Natronocalculus amylovorans]MCL9818308.1 glycosyltransferase family 2 protein [Natronocalculus amylovorans]